MGKAQDLSFGDLILDETCLFARRNGKTIQFTRSERALLLAFTRNPHRLMPRSRLLYEIASAESDSRNIDFLVNRLRTKLGDRAKSSKYIATQYGEGYVWIAVPSPVPVAAPQLAPTDGLLAIVPAFATQDHRFGQQALSLVDRLRNMIAAGVDAGQNVVVVENARSERMRYVLQVSFQADNGRLDCAATLREMPSKHIVKAFRLDLDSADAASFTVEATRVSHGVVEALQQALTDASTGLGTPTDQPLEIRLRKASALLSSSNPTWLERGQYLSAERAKNPSNADIALQWCLHLFARLVLDSPFSGGMSLDDRDAIESEIETTVLDYLPLIEANPLLMLAAAKLLYFINRGHLDLAEDLAERAFARTADFAAALPVLGQLRQARGNFNEAMAFFDRGIETAEADSEFLLHMRVLKCIALLAAGDRAALEFAATFSLDTAHCPPDTRVLIRLMLTPGDQPLPAAVAKALVAAGPAGARGAVAVLYFTSARQHTSERARANVMGGIVAHVTSLHGPQAIPAFVLAGTGLAAAG
jgi:hypothetical protein